jgi:hypothetical protein
MGDEFLETQPSETLVNRGSTSFAVLKAYRKEIKSALSQGGLTSAQTEISELIERGNPGLSARFLLPVVKAYSEYYGPNKL